MNRFGSFALAASLQACSWIWASLGHADAVAACRPTLHVEAGLDPAWNAQAEEVRGQLGRFSDAGTCARLTVGQRSGAVWVEIELADGRAAARSIDAPQALQSTVEALLTSLPTPPPAGATAPVQAKETPDESAKDRDAPSPASTSRTQSLDLAIAVSSRLAGTPYYLGYGLVAQLDVCINDWLVGSWVRWDFRDRPLGHSVPPQFMMGSFLLGAFAGRRFDLGKGALELVAGPNLAVETEESAGPSGVDSGGEMGAFSVGAATRVLVPREGTRFFGLLAGELVPNRLSHAERADPALPALPSWGVTLALGASWNVL